MSTDKELLQRVRRIAEEITSGKLEKENYNAYHDLTDEEKEDFEPNGYDYLENVYDMKFIVGRDKSYYGAELMVAGGGPNIYVDTREMRVEGYWGGDRATWNFIDNIGLDDACEEYWSCQ